MLASLYVHYSYTLKQLTLAKLAGYILGSNEGTHSSAGGDTVAAKVDHQPGRDQSPTGGSGTAKLSSTAQ